MEWNSLSSECGMARGRVTQLPWTPTDYRSQRAHSTVYTKYDMHPSEWNNFRGLNILHSQFLDEKLLNKQLNVDEVTIRCDIPTNILAIHTSTSILLFLFTASSFSIFPLLPAVESGPIYRPSVQLRYSTSFRQKN